MTSTLVAALVLTLGFLAAVTVGASVLPGAFPYLAWSGTGLAVLLAVGRSLLGKPLQKPIGKQRDASPIDDRPLLGAVNRIVIAAGIPMPRVVVVDVDGGGANAWTRRTSKHEATIFVTQGLLNRVTPGELEAVLAHEVGHIINRDTDLRRVVSACLFLPGTVLRLFRTLTWDSENRFAVQLGMLLAILLWFPLVVAVVFYFISFEIMMRFSRQRELAADQYSKVLIGGSGSLASALLKLSGRSAPRMDLRLSDPRAAEMILPTYREDGWEDLRKAFLRTHPSVRRRLRELDVDLKPSTMS